MSEQDLTVQSGNSALVAGNSFFSSAAVHCNVAATARQRQTPLFHCTLQGTLGTADFR